MSIITQAKGDLHAHREVFLAQGFWAIQIYRFGHYQFTHKNRLIRIVIRLVHIVLNKVAEMLFGISIGVSAKIGHGLCIEHFGGVIIHGSAVIGDNCIIRQGVTIGNRYMDRPLDAPTLGNGVIVGAGAKILGKLTIGDDVKIGANAVVLDDVPSGATVVGVPARIVNSTYA